MLKYNNIRTFKYIDKYFAFKLILNFGIVLLILYNCVHFKLLSE